MAPTEIISKSRRDELMEAELYMNSIIRLTGASSAREALAKVKEMYGGTNGHKE